MYAILNHELGQVSVAYVPCIQKIGRPTGLRGHLRTTHKPCYVYRKWYISEERNGFQNLCFIFKHCLVISHPRDTYTCLFITMLLLKSCKLGSMDERSTCRQRLFPWTWHNCLLSIFYKICCMKTMWIYHTNIMFFFSFSFHSKYSPESLENFSLESCKPFYLMYNVQFFLC